MEKSDTESSKRAPRTHQGINEKVRTVILVVLLLLVVGYIIWSHYEADFTLGN